MSTHALQLPLHHPVRLAEDVAVLDVLSDGRMEIGVAAGYRAAEFAGLGIDRRERWDRLEEACRVLTRAWTEDGWTHTGRLFAFDGVSVHPKPVQQPHPPLWIGATTPAAARRAADLGGRLMLAPPPFTADEAATYAAYAERLCERGIDPSAQRVAATLTCVVTDDPESYRAGRRARWRHQSALYREWGARGSAGTTRPTSVVGDAATCIAAIRALRAGPVPMTDVIMSLDATEQLERFAAQVRPAFADGTATGAG